MKRVTLSIILVAALAILFGLGNTSVAYHDGGVAECTGCHSMHNSTDKFDRRQ